LSSVSVSNYKLNKQKLLLLISRNHMLVQTFLEWFNRVCCSDILWWLIPCYYYSALLYWNLCQLTIHVCWFCYSKLLIKYWLSLSSLPRSPLPLPLTWWEHSWWNVASLRQGVKT